MNEKKSAEESFRESLKDLVLIAQRLAPVCSSIEELVGMAGLALENDGQLRLLMSTVITQGKK